MALEIPEIATRIGLAFLTGFVLGVERESHGRAAGLRTLVLVCVAAATAAMLSDFFYANSFSGEEQSTNWRPDPARLGAGILTGIGFLGAGVILRHGNLVRGVTTASLIWLATILGLCYGSGQFEIGLAGFAVAILIVFVLPFVENFIKRDWYGTLSVVVSADGATASQISQTIKSLGIRVKNIELNHNLVQKTRTFRCGLKYKKSNLTQLSEKAVQSLIALPGVMEVDWK